MNVVTAGVPNDAADVARVYALNVGARMRPARTWLSDAIAFSTVVQLTYFETTFLLGGVNARSTNSGLLATLITRIAALIMRIAAMLFGLPAFGRWL